MPALAIDNPHLPESYIENLWNLPEQTKQRLLFGNFDYDDSDDMLVEFNQIQAIFTNVVQDVTPYYMTVDVAGSGKDNTVFAI